MPRGPEVIRKATIGDREAIVELATTFLEEVGYHDSTVAAAGIVDRCLSAALPADACDNDTDAVAFGEGGGLFVIDRDGTVDGFFGFIIGDHPITGELTAFELGWYVRQGHRRGTQGIRLLLVAREAATRLGAAVLQVSALDDRLGRFLETYAFEKRESTYTLRLSDDTIQIP